MRQDGRPHLQTRGQVQLRGAGPAVACRAPLALVARPPGLSQDHPTGHAEWPESKWRPCEPVRGSFPSCYRSLGEGCAEPGRGLTREFRVQGLSPTARATQQAGRREEERPGLPGPRGVFRSLLSAPRADRLGPGISQPDCWAGPRRGEQAPLSAASGSSSAEPLLPPFLPREHRVAVPQAAVLSGSPAGLCAGPAPWLVSRPHTPKAGGRLGRETRPGRHRCPSEPSMGCAHAPQGNADWPASAERASSARSPATVTLRQCVPLKRKSLSAPFPVGVRTHVPTDSMDSGASRKSGNLAGRAHSVT